MRYDVGYTCFLTRFPTNLMLSLITCEIPSLPYLYSGCIMTLPHSCTCVAQFKTEYNEMG